MARTRTKTSTRCCRQRRHVSYSHTSSFSRLFSLVKVVVSVTCAGGGRARGSDFAPLRSCQPGLPSCPSHPPTLHREERGGRRDAPPPPLPPRVMLAGQGCPTALVPRPPPRHTHLCLALAPPSRPALSRPALLPGPHHATRTSARTLSKMGMSTESNTRRQNGASKLPPCARSVSNSTSSALLRIWSLRTTQRQAGIACHAQSRNSARAGRQRAARNKLRRTQLVAACARSQAGPCCSTRAAVGSARHRQLLWLLLQPLSLCCFNPSNRWGR